MALSLAQLTAKNAKRRVVKTTIQDPAPAGEPARPWEDCPADLSERIGARFGKANGQDGPKVVANEIGPHADPGPHTTDQQEIVLRPLTEGVGEIAREQPGNNPGATRQQMAADSGTTREQSINNPGATRQQVAVGSGTTHKQPANNPGATRQQMAADSGTTREQPVNNPGATREQVAVDSGTTRKQPVNNSGTTQEHKAADPGTTWEQLGNNPGTMSDSPGIHPGTTREQKAVSSEIKSKLGSNPGTNIGKTRANSGTTREQPRNNSGTSTDKTRTNPGTTQEQPGNNSGTVVGKSHENPGTTREQLTRVDDADPGTSEAPTPRSQSLPRGRGQLAILNFLHLEQAKNGGKITPLFSRQQIADATGVAKETLKVTIQRLVGAGLLRRNSVSFAANGGGASYSLPRHVVSRLITESTDPGTNARVDPGTNAFRGEDVGSSRNLNTSTSTNPRARDNAATEAIERQVSRLGLDAEDLRVGANDLVGVWRDWGEDAELGRFISSVEHAVFYVRNSPDAKGEKGIKHPKAWLMKTLRKGYYPAPAGFISEEERQAVAAAEDAKQRLVRLRAARKDAFVTEFEIWKLEKTATELSQFLPEFGCSGPNSPAARVPLWEAFAAETGREELLPMVLAEDQFGTATT